MVAAMEHSSQLQQRGAMVVPIVMQRLNGQAARRTRKGTAADWASTLLVLLLALSSFMVGGGCSGSCYGRGCQISEWLNNLIWLLNGACRNLCRVEIYVDGAANPNQRCELCNARIGVIISDNSRTYFQDQLGPNGYPITVGAQEINAWTKVRRIILDPCVTVNNWSDHAELERRMQELLYNSLLTARWCIKDCPSDPLRGSEWWYMPSGRQLPRATIDPTTCTMKLQIDACKQGLQMSYCSQCCIY